MQVSTPPRGRARQARAEALAGRLYAAHRPRLLAIARRNSEDPAEAEEALHDVFVIFIDRFDPEGEANPLAWLTLTLKRHCWALYGRQRRGFSRTDPDSASQLDVAPGQLGAAYRLPGELAEVAGEIEALWERMATLKRDERRALGLLALGYSYREIREITGWTYTKVNRCLAEGRAAMRELARSAAEETSPRSTHNPGG